MSGLKSSAREELPRAAVRVALGLLLLLPYLIWIAEISEWSVPEPRSWWPAVSRALVQATLSSAAACGGGWLLFHALQAARARSLTEASLLLPNVMPPLFAVLSWSALLSELGATPSGLTSVVALHALLNSGIAAISLDRVVRGKLGGQIEAAWVMGVRPAEFWTRIAWPQLRGDFACILLFVFSLSLTSFSIPLLLSGGRAVSLEVAIYDTLRSGRWDEAVLLAALQSAGLLVLALLLPRSFWLRPRAAVVTELFAWRRWRWLPAAPLAILGAGWACGLTWTPDFTPQVRAALAPAALTTFAVGLGTGALHLILFIGAAFALPHRRLDQFLNGYLAPSPAITGFGLLLLPPQGEWAGLLRLVVALTLISFPLLYRWIVHSALTALRGQITVARVMGASWPAILFDVVWPQAGAACLRACGLAGVWASGDFAVAGIFLSSGETLPLLMQNLMNNYHGAEAALLLAPVAVICMVVYFVFVGAARYVAG